jgi:serine/threonine protein kinase
LETNEQVAIKVIDKTRFSEQEDKIHREVDILHEISHPGVIKLHAMFDTPGKVILKSKEGDFMGKINFFSFIWLWRSYIRICLK